MDDLNKTIKTTQDYAHKYGQSLNDRQLYLRLISKKIYKFSEIKGKGVKHKENTIWQDKINLVKELVERHLIKFGGIKMVAITGSVATEWTKDEEDIDLLIVTRTEELWWWRLFLRFYIRWHKIPHRKFGQEENKNEFCFNLWLDENNLKIPKEKRNLKNATDLVMMKVVLDRDNCYQRFLRENFWAKEYLATGYNMLVNKKLTNISKFERNWIKVLGNKIIFWGQYFYMWSKSRRKLKNIGEGQAFFHKGD